MIGSPALDRQALHIGGISLPTGAYVGGVLHDHRGGFVRVVAGSSGLAFGRTVDVHALLQGVELADRSICYFVEVWSESHFLVDNIALMTPLSDCEHSWATIQQFSRQHGLGLHHSRRHGYAIAIAMAEWGLSIEHLTFIFSLEAIPLALRRAIARDTRVFVDPGG